MERGRCHLEETFSTIPFVLFLVLELSCELSATFRSRLEKPSYVELCLNMKMDAFIRCHIRMFEYLGGVLVRTVCDNLKTDVVYLIRKALRITGTVKQNGTNYSVSSFATKGFSNVDVKSIIIDMVVSENTRTVAFMSKTFKGSEVKNLTLRPVSSRKVRFSSGTVF